MTDTRIVPAKKKHLPVVEHDWMKIMVLIKAELANITPFAVHQVQVTHALATVPAWNRLV